MNAAPTLAFKTCSRCKRIKRLDEFKRWRPAGRAQVWQSYCRECNSAYDREYRAANPDKIAAYRVKHKERERQREKNRWPRRRLEKYGITQEQYDALMERAGGACEFCGTTENLVIDHCHVTNRVRGILCRPHNAAFGLFGDTLESVERAAEYLRERVYEERV